MRCYVLGCLARARGGCPLEKQNETRQGWKPKGRRRVAAPFTTARPRKRGRPWAEAANQVAHVLRVLYATATLQELF